LLVRQLASDEDEATLARLAILPGPLMVAVEDHVHALEDESLRIILERENPLAAQDARSFLLHQVLDPWKELVGIERPVAPERERLHLLVVIMLEAAAVMMMVMLAMPVIMP